jgi:hypothetical protein
LVELDEVFVVGISLSAESVDAVQGRGVVGVELRREEAGKAVGGRGPVVEVVERALDLFLRRRQFCKRKKGKRKVSNRLSINRIARHLAKPDEFESYTPNFGQTDRPNRSSVAVRSKSIGRHEQSGFGTHRGEEPVPQIDSATEHERIVREVVGGKEGSEVAINAKFLLIPVEKKEEEGRKAYRMTVSKVGTPAGLASMSVSGFNSSLS